MAEQKDQYWAVVPAAGSGQRFGSATPKQYLTIAGRPLIEHTLGRLLQEPRIERVVVALSEDDPRWSSLSLANHTRVITTQGGAERYLSVLNGLQALDGLANENDWVLVHDVARPCLLAADLQRLIETLADDAVGGLLAEPVTDTVKQVDADGRVEQTLDRSHLWRAQTPQMFRFGALRDALRQVVEQGGMVTDEAAAMEAAGHKPKQVAGSRCNLKVTLPEDFAMAEYYLHPNKEQR